MNNKDYIRSKLDRRTLLENLAEEAAELSQAALKVIRAEKLSPNVTDKSAFAARNNLIEEVRDILCVIDMLEIDIPDNGEEYWKIERWKSRLEK